MCHEVLELELEMAHWTFLVSLAHTGTSMLCPAIHHSDPDECNHAHPSQFPTNCGC